ncbi:hypothetical protein [Paenibacillus qinlingensis]|uniref:Phage holin n=1 Tax=Paenibacillus qinlingensis TaxID=1837343 RepID=A0ABU1P6N3_9BACL|nr:hypothetical protein [Paenibacillus qinlingensis]MDR6555421.1 hypothetical protein [Paenibacillus qinlingensis]
MKKFNKQLIIPILTLLALIAKQMFHIDIPDAAIDLGADLIMGAISLAGFFIHPHVTETTQTGGTTNGAAEPIYTIENNK